MNFFFGKVITNLIFCFFFIVVDDIRCYCNLAKCVATGYMCRTKNTETGGCFSEVSYSQAAGISGNGEDKSGNSASFAHTLATRHGCIDLLQSE